MAGYNPIGSSAATFQSAYVSLRVNIHENCERGAGELFSEIFVAEALLHQMVSVASARSHVRVPSHWPHIGNVYTKVTHH